MLKVICLPAYNDNYIWVLHQYSTDYCAFVNPRDDKVCIEYLRHSNAKLCAIFITHSHKNLSDCVKSLIAYCQLKNWPISVYYPEKEPIEGGTINVSEPDHITIDLLGLAFDILDLPGHTLGHIAYFNHQMLFCGNTLFSGGCGRIISGTATQLKASLDKISSLSPKLKVYSGHEYTQENLKFACLIEPKNINLLKYREYIDYLRLQKQVTLPTTLARESLINPFLRCDRQEIKAHLEMHFNTQFNSEIALFIALNEYKNLFEHQ